MQAIVYHRYGPPDVLQFQEIPKPAPSDDEVLIRVRCASANPYDWHFLRGTPIFIRIITGLRHPKSPRLGADVAGQVESVGAAVTRFKPGDEVFGTCGGSFAEYACAPEKTLAIKPRGLTFEDAAALPIAGITALQALRDCGHLTAGQTTLINGASGGVGIFAVQLARHFGAKVTAVCSTRNVDLVRSLGADSVIDYTREDFTRLPAKFDVLFDLVGNRSLAELRRVLQPRGIFVGCGGGGPNRSSFALLAGMLGHAAVSPFVSQKITGVFASINPQDLGVLADLVLAGAIQPVIDRTFPVSETANAIRYVEKGHARGKVLIAVA